MTRADSFDLTCPRSPTDAPNFVSVPKPRSPLPESRSPNSKAIQIPSTRYWSQEARRRAFLYHLTQWSLSHDSCAQFHGSISLIQDPKSSAELELGRSVSCILTDSTFRKLSKTIVIRLFPPSNKSTTRRPRRGQNKDMTSQVSDLNFSEWQRNQCSTVEDNESIQGSGATGNTHYKLLIRCGSGWMTAREYFSKLYLTRLVAFQRKPSGNRSFSSRKANSKGSSPPLTDKDSVVVRPLFHPFLRLPPELQEMILLAAAGYTGVYDLCCPMLFDSTPTSRSPISTSTLFRISKELSSQLVPYFFHKTNFHFSLTGFTNFLWRCGPRNRGEIRNLTFHFGKLSLLHCMRWLAVNEVFELLEPPVVTSPRSLQFFWRCQIQDLVRELHLDTLTIDLFGVPKADIPMVLRILESSFNFQRLNFVDKDERRNTKVVKLSEDMLQQVEALTWREMCKDYWSRHKITQYYFRSELMNMGSVVFDTLMDADGDFFGIETK